MRAAHKVGKKIFTTAKYKYGFATVVMEPSSMTATPKFDAAIKEAMKSSEKRAALEDVIAKYGHTFPTEVILGGLLETTESTTTTAEVQCLFATLACLLTYLTGNRGEARMEAQDGYQNGLNCRDVLGRGRSRAW